MRTYHLAGSEVNALRGVDLEIAPGTFTALVGPSGSGKSTLLRLLACVDRPDDGSIVIDGLEAATLSRRGRLRLRRRSLGFMFQAPADNLLDYLTVRQHLRLAAQLRGGHGRANRRARAGELSLAGELGRARATGGGHETDLLDRLGLADRADHLPRQLSGGEQQRVGIAFAAFGPPALLLADEPTGQLDHGAVDAVLDAFMAMAESGVAVVAATHDPAVARRAHQVIRMRDGVIEEHS
jgi:ABC-type lipoprotein export system ATPase subunit